MKAGFERGILPQYHSGRHGEKQPTCPSADGCVSNMWPTHTMENYSSFKREEILTPATAWMTLENIMLSGISQLQKDKGGVIQLVQDTCSVVRVTQADRRTATGKDRAFLSNGISSFRFAR